MDLDEVIALINAEIVANGNQEITADVLRPILIAMLEQPNDLIGDLNDLTTVDTTNLVAAINEINAGGSSDQNNVTKHYGTFGLSGTGEMTIEEVAAFVNTQSWDIEVSPTDTPVYISFMKDNVYYIFDFVRGLGTYPTVDETDFLLVSARPITSSDVSQPNSETFNLDPLGGDTFVEKANLSTWDFSDSGELDENGYPKNYYFSYTEDGTLYYALFIGDPNASPYGDGGTPFVEGDFVTTTSGGSTITPNLHSVLTAGNQSDLHIFLRGGEDEHIEYAGDKIQKKVGDFATDLTFQTPTANNTQIFQDKSGTVALLDDIPIESHPRLLYTAVSDTDTFTIPELVGATEVQMIASNVSGNTMKSMFTFTSGTGEISGYPVLTGEEHLIYYTP